MSSLRTAIPLVAGLAVGAVGAILFLQSMPPPEGSPQERIGKLEEELKKANNRVAALEAADPTGRKRPGRTVMDGARNLAQDFKEGKPVTPDDIFRTIQPMFREISPVMELMRKKELKRETDRMAGELTRKYNLTEAQGESLKKWLAGRADEEAKNYINVLTQKGTSAEEIAKAQREMRLDDGLETFMERTLSGEKLASFRSQHMLEKVDRVQKEADMKVERLGQVVNLDETQRGQLFGLMARGSRDFVPGMSFEGAGTDQAPLATGASKQQAILQVLTPDQRETYQSHLQKRRDDAQRDLSEIGLTLPENFDPFDF